MCPPCGGLAGAHAFQSADVRCDVPRAAAPVLCAGALSFRPGARPPSAQGHGCVLFGSQQPWTWGGGPPGGGGGGGCPPPSALACPGPHSARGIPPPPRRRVPCPTERARHIRRRRKVKCDMSVVPAPQAQYPTQLNVASNPEATQPGVPTHSPRQSSMFRGPQWVPPNRGLAAVPP